MGQADRSHIQHEIENEANKLFPGSDTPITWLRAPAGFVSGPRKLKTVRTPSALRTGTMCLKAG